MNGEVFKTLLEIQKVKVELLEKLSYLFEEEAELTKNFVEWLIKYCDEHQIPFWNEEQLKSYIRLSLRNQKEIGDMLTDLKELDKSRKLPLKKFDRRSPEDLPEPHIWSLLEIQSHIQQRTVKWFPDGRRRRVIEFLSPPPHQQQQFPLTHMESLIFQVAISQRMAYPREKVAGMFFFIAATQFVLGLTIAEALYPGYSVSDNYISDLGIGPSSIIFNSSVFLLGLLLLIGTYFLRQISDFKTVNAMLLLMAIGAMGVGVFTKDSRTTHGAVASMAFFFSGLSAISSFQVLKKPLSLISIILGAMTLVALVLFSSGMITSGSLTSDVAYDNDFYLGLGPGGMEHMIVYPALMWLAGFSGHLVTQQEILTKE